MNSITFLQTFLPIIIYILLIILLIVGIILGIRSIQTLNKVDKVVDDVNDKVQSLNGFFNLIDYTTDKLALFSDKFVNIISSVIKKVFVKKGEKNANYYK